MVNNRKKESRMEGVDMRFVQTEQNVERLGIEFDSMKDEMASMKLLLQEIASGMRDKPNRNDPKSKEIQEPGRKSQETHQEDKGETSKTMSGVGNSEFSQLRKLEMSIFSGGDPL